MSEYTVVDVSRYNKIIDWAKAKPYIGGAIIQVGYGRNIAKQDDPYGVRNITECERLGIPWGPYIYSYASSVDAVKSEFEHAKRICKDYRPSFPWYLDLEENKYGSFARTAAKTWYDLCKKEGVMPGIYTGAYYFKSFISGVNLPGCSWWIAAYGTNNGLPQERFKPRIGIYYDGWQYTSVKKIDGFPGVVDASIFYKTFPMNSYGKPKPAPTTPVNNKSVDELAKEVLDGKWGNGDDRQRRLTEAGYDYNAVQKRVNEMLKEKQPQVKKKTIDELAKEVIDGKWKTGADRIRLLTESGYDANAVQKRVNELLKTSNTITYTVKKGDTLARIGSNYGVDYKKIAKDNGIVNPNLIYPGQKIKIIR